jgi:hypothetical protein
MRRIVCRTRKVNYARSTKRALIAYTFCLMPHFVVISCLVHNILVILDFKALRSIDMLLWRLNFQWHFIILHSLFINRYHYSIFTNLLFTSILHDRVYISPVIKNKFKIVQRGFNERDCFGGPFPHFGRGFTVVSSGGENIKLHTLTPW